MAAILYDLLNESPNIKIEISLANLIEAIDYSTKAAIETKHQQDQAQEEAETLIPRFETADRLSTTTQTLSRWAKIGYLQPQKVGAKVFYRLSDINAILKNRA